ncbi:hypothetical protein [Yoonia sp. BS5-3]|uniref:COG4223 family protein n=1 Tax=Yoonia phaeophyticola TaxID=3137369 RepID=A0ABZ2V8Y9_9RHOB
MAKQPAKGRKPPAKPEKTTQSGKATGESAKPEKLMLDAIPAEHLTKPADDTPKTEKPAAEPAKPAAAQPVEPAVAPVATPPPAAPAKRQSIFLPLLFGGVLAGGIGFAVANLTRPAGDDTLELELASQARSIAALEAQVDGLSGLQTAQTEQAAALTDLTAQMGDLDARLTALENLPRGEGVGSVPAIAAYEAELDALRAQITDMTGVAQTELAAARAEAAAIEENAEAAARAAAGRAALARLRTGMENGAPLGAALADLEDALGAPAPDALLAAQDGVPTLASLQDGFPDAARAALATARREGVSGEDTGGFGGFLRNQFDVRSVTPQEGTSVDAILSRAEFAVREGRLSDGLAEIGALPEVARAELSEWLAQAELRADAIAAVDILSTSLSDN